MQFLLDFYHSCSVRVSANTNFVTLRSIARQNCLVEKKMFHTKILNCSVLLFKFLWFRQKSNNPKVTLLIAPNIHLAKYIRPC
jgi:hypothetical protein